MSPHQFEQGWTCPHCDMIRGEDYHDPCIGRLPGVDFACCGHGGKGQCPGYISFRNGTVVRFRSLYAVEKWEGCKLVKVRYHNEVEMVDFVPIGS